MKPLVIMLFLFCSFLSSPILAQVQQVVVHYTLADRDRAIITEEKLSSLGTSINGRISSLESRINSLESSINLRFEAQQRQLDDIKILFYWGFGILITLFIFMLGYMIWDRRTAMQPALLQASRAEENSRNLITTLREYSKKHADLAEILRSHGIL
jgi:hypothetical protein